MTFGSAWSIGLTVPSFAGEALRQRQIFEDLKRVLLKTIGLGDAPREDLQPARDGIVIALL